MLSKKELRRVKIKKGIRGKISGTAQRPRLSVFRSNTAIYAQLIDDVAGKTLVSASSLELEGKENNLSSSTQVGQKLAEKALSTGITMAVFDRNGYLYHGKIKALADGARNGGLIF
jgi:large subunit ribosomal protein L18